MHVELDDATSVGLDRVTVVRLDAGAHHRPVERRDIGDGQASVTEPRPATARRGEQLAAKGLEDGACGQPLGVAHGDGRARERDAVRVVRRAVERVDEPRARAVGLAGEAFLAQDGVVGKRGRDDVDDLVLRGDVSPRDDRRAFALQLDLRRPSEALHQHGPAGPRGRDGDLEQRVDGRRARRWHVRRRSGTAGGEHRLDERLRALVVGVDHVGARAVRARRCEVVALVEVVA